MKDHEKPGAATWRLAMRVDRRVYKYLSSSWYAIVVHEGVEAMQRFFGSSKSVWGLGRGYAEKSALDVWVSGVLVTLNHAGKGTMETMETMAESGRG